MVEFFEITFFKEKAFDLQKDTELLSNLLQIMPGKNVCTEHGIRLFAHRTVVLEPFEECGFVEYQLSLEGLVFCKENYREVLGAMAEVAAACFETIPDIAFATGIYELTYYYSEHAKGLQDVVQQLVPRCPLLFLRESDRDKYPNAVEYGGILVVEQEGDFVQKIISECLR